MTPFDAQAETRLMTAVRDIAAEVILPRFRALDPSEVDSKADADDLVTIADRESEHRLEEAVAAILPDAVTVGEEAVSEGRTKLSIVSEAEMVVIVDPIDGTWNFANGIGSFGVILAVVHRGQTIWGGIYDPLGDDWITARAGGGAWFIRRGKRVAVSARGGPVTLGEAHGYLPVFYFEPGKRGAIIDSFHDVRRLNNVGCAAHEYRTVAQGRVDFVLSAGLKPWDHAAGALIVTEAGGVARLVDGRAYGPTITDGHLLSARNEVLWNAAAERYAFLK